jgi:hypothetical protein
MSPPNDDDDPLKDDDDPLKKAQRAMAEANARGKIVPIAPKREEKERKKHEHQERQQSGEHGKEFKLYPPDAPVSCLGCNVSDYYFLDAIRQLVIKPSDKMGTNAVNDLFKHPAAQRWAEENFPRLGPSNNIIGIDRDRLNRALMAECGLQGVFNPDGRVRGVGGWPDPHGHLVFHCGGVLLTADINGRLYESRPGVAGQYIYPAGDEQLRPAPEPCDYKPAVELFDALKTWHWKRGDLDARLMLGWLVLAPIAGALRWRPTVWVTGDKATGKSTLQQELVRWTQGGPLGLVQAADATGAGIWQALKWRSLPVALDEIEAETDNTKKESIIHLMRISSSGDQLVRGGSGHQGVRFNAYSTFLFSSINMLSLTPQDMSRVAVLELLPLARGSERPNLDPNRLAKIGSALRRRVIMAWPRFEELLSPWTAPLEKDFDKRTSDTFGFLLASADLALNDGPADPDSVEEVIAPLLPTLRDWADIAGSDDELMLNRLATWQLEPLGDNRRKLSVRQLVFWASERSARSVDLKQHQEDYGEPVPRSKANEALRRHGLAVVRVRDPGIGGEYLAIAIRNDSLQQIFRRTKWQNGGWRQSAGRVPGAVPLRKERFQGLSEPAVLIPVEAMLGADADDLAGR